MTAKPTNEVEMKKTKTQKIRSVEEIQNAIKEIGDRMLYKCQQRAMQDSEELPNNWLDERYDCIEDFLFITKRYMKEIEDRYGEENLGSYSDEEWDWLYGMSRALNWVLGEKQLWAWVPPTKKNTRNEEDDDLPFKQNN